MLNCLFCPTVLGISFQYPISQMLFPLEKPGCLAQDGRARLEESDPLYRLHRAYGPVPSRPWKGLGVAAWSIAHSAVKGSAWHPVLPDFFLECLLPCGGRFATSKHTHLFWNAVYLLFSDLRPLTRQLQKQLFLRVTWSTWEAKLRKREGIEEASVSVIFISSSLFLGLFLLISCHGHIIYICKSQTAFDSGS